MITVGVGVDLNRDVLKSMAYTEDHYFDVPDILDVEKTVWQVASKVSRSQTLHPICTLFFCKYTLIDIL